MADRAAQSTRTARNILDLFAADCFDVPHRSPHSTSKADDGDANRSSSPDISLCFDILFPPTAGSRCHGTRAKRLRGRATFSPPGASAIEIDFADPQESGESALPRLAAFPTAGNRGRKGWRRSLDREERFAQPPHTILILPRYPSARVTASSACRIEVSPQPFIQHCFLRFSSSP